MKKVAFFIISLLILSTSISLIISCFPPAPLYDSNNDIDDDDDDDDVIDYVNNTNNGTNTNTNTNNTNNNNTNSNYEDQYEVDDTFDQAKVISIASTQTRTIYKTTGYDVDYIRFTCKKDVIYIITMSNNYKFYPEMTLYASDKTTIIEMKSTLFHTDTYGWNGFDNNNNYNPEEVQSIIFTADADGVYYIRIKDIDNANNGGIYNIRVIERIVPGTTNSLQATAEKPNLGIRLTWSSIINAEGYQIFRSLSNDISTFTQIAAVTGGANTNYLDTNINYNTTYYYYIKGYYGTVTGAMSNIANANLEITVGTTTLTAVSNPQNFQIDLSWTQINDAQGYYIYRKTGAESYALIQTITDNSTLTYSDTNIQPNTTYDYYIVGYYATVLGDPSYASATFDWATFKPTSEIINASEGLIDFIRVTLTKKYNNSNIIRYEVYRSNTNVSYNSVVKINDFLGSAPLGSYIDDSIGGGTYYYYCVRIVILINGSEVKSDYSYYDSGIAGN